MLVRRTFGIVLRVRNIVPRLLLRTATKSRSKIRIQQCAVCRERQGGFSWHNRLPLPFLSRRSFQLFFDLRLDGFVVNAVRRTATAAGSSNHHGRFLVVVAWLCRPLRSWFVERIAVHFCPRKLRFDGRVRGLQGSPRSPRVSVHRINP